MLRDALKTHQSTLTPKLWTTLESAKPGDASLLPSASALASYDPDDARWEAAGGKVAQALVSVNSVFLGPWIEALRPVRGKLTDPLATIFRDKNRPESEHAWRPDILADYARDDPDLIANLLMDADPKAYAAFFPIAQRQESKTLPLFQAEIDKKATIPDSKDSETVKDRLAERQARAAIALVRMGKADEICPPAAQCRSPPAELHRQLAQPSGSRPEDPRRRTRPPPATPSRLPPGATVMDAVLFHPETSKRRALILAMGTYGTEGLSRVRGSP